MSSYPGKTIVSRIMVDEKQNGQQICRATTLPMFEVMALIQGRMSFDEDKANKFADAYPDAGVSASGWLTMQAEYDAEEEVWLPNHPGWYVVTRIMGGCYDDESVWAVYSNIELAEKLNVTQEDLDDLINWKVPMDYPMAQKLVVAFPNIGIDSEQWIWLQTNYEENYEPPEEP